MASDDLKTVSEVKFQESMYFWPQKEAKAMEYVIQAVKISFQLEIFSKFFFAGSSKI